MSANRQRLLQTCVYCRSILTLAEHLTPLLIKSILHATGPIPIVLLAAQAWFGLAGFLRYLRDVIRLELAANLLKLDKLPFTIGHSLQLLLGRWWRLELRLRTALRLIRVFSLDVVILANSFISVISLDFPNSTIEIHLSIETQRILLLELLN